MNCLNKNDIIMLWILIPVQAIWKLQKPSKYYSGKKKKK